jgi:hypothetical protein
MKRRIDSLLQGGKDKDAIALAEKANLVCRGAAFVAWDEAEKVPVAEDEIYQPSLRVESRFLLARPRRASSSHSVREIIETRSHFASDFPGSRGTEYYQKAVLDPRSDKELVGDSFDVKGKSLTEKLKAIIDSAFSAPDSKKLVSILQDWARNTDEKQITRRFAGLCANVSEAGAQSVCASCSQTFFSRCRILGKQEPVQYFQHRHLVDAWRCNNSEEISGRRRSNSPTDYYHGFDEPMAVLAAILSDAEIWDPWLRKQ